MKPDTRVRKSSAKGTAAKAQEKPKRAYKRRDKVPGESEVTLTQNSPSSPENTESSSSTPSTQAPPTQAAPTKVASMQEHLVHARLAQLRGDSLPSPSPSLPQSITPTIERTDSPTPQPSVSGPRLIPAEHSLSRELTGWSETQPATSQPPSQIGDDVEKGSRGQRLTQSEKVTLAQLTTHEDFRKLYGSVGKGWVTTYWTNVTARFVNERPGRQLYSWQSAKRTIESLAAIRREEVAKEETGKEANTDDLAQALDAYIEMDDDYQERVRLQAELTVEVIHDVEQAEAARSNLLYRLKGKRQLEGNEEADRDDSDVEEVEELIPEGDGQPEASRKELLKRNKSKQSEQSARKKKARKSDPDNEDERELTKAMIAYFKTVTQQAAKENERFTKLEKMTEATFSLVQALAGHGRVESNSNKGSETETEDDNSEEL